MDNVLRTFYNNSIERETVKAFMVEVLKEIAVGKTFNGESVVGIQEANKLVEKMFDKLDEQYGKIEGPIINNSR